MEQKIVTVGLDLANNVFQAHAIATGGAMLIRRKWHRTEVIRFFTDFRLAWSAWKRVRGRITGGAS